MSQVWGSQTKKAAAFFEQKSDHRYRMSVFVFAISAVTLWATLLHAAEASLWAASYRYLGALSDYGMAMLYSLGAIPTYGHSGCIWKSAGISWERLRR
jgi:hypothetical protein